MGLFWRHLRLVCTFQHKLVTASWSTVLGMDLLWLFQAYFRKSSSHHASNTLTGILCTFALYVNAGTVGGQLKNRIVVKFPSPPCSRRVKVGYIQSRVYRSFCSLRLNDFLVLLTLGTDSIPSSRFFLWFPPEKTTTAIRSRRNCDPIAFTNYEAVKWWARACVKLRHHEELVVWQRDPGGSTSVAIPSVPKLIFYYF